MDPPYFFCQAEDGIRARSPSRGLGDVYKRQSDYPGFGKNIVIANPNAPTGRIIGVDDIEKIVCSRP